MDSLCSIQLCVFSLFSSSYDSPCYLLPLIIGRKREERGELEEGRGGREGESGRRERERE